MSGRPMTMGEIVEAETSAVCRYCPCPFCDEIREQDAWDRFAAAAMEQPTNAHGDGYKIRAEWAACFADALMAERAKRMKEPQPLNHPQPDNGDER